MPTNPTRLRNWSELVRQSEGKLYEHQTQTLANMLAYCAKRFERYEDRIAKLEDENAGLLRDLDMLSVGPWDER